MPNKISIVVPTLDLRRGRRTAFEAELATRLTNVETFVQLDKKHEGFTKTVNKGIRAADPRSDICLLNDDVSHFQLGWLELLHNALYLDKTYGLAGPSGASAAAPMNQGTPGMSGIQVVEQISFWCVLLKRAMIDDIGLLDEAFIHYCSDNWYCYQMRKAGWKCVWAKAVYLEHKKHGSGMQRVWRKHDRQIYFERIRA